MKIQYWSHRPSTQKSNPRCQEANLKIFIRKLINFSVKLEGKHSLIGSFELIFRLFLKPWQPSGLPFCFCFSSICHGIETGLAPSVLEIMCEIQFEIYHEFYSERKGDEICNAPCTHIPQPITHANINFVIHLLLICTMFGIIMCAK